MLALYLEPTSSCLVPTIPFKNIDNGWQFVLCNQGNLVVFVGLIASKYERALLTSYPHSSSVLPNLKISELKKMRAFWRKTATPGQSGLSGLFTT